MFILSWRREKSSDIQKESPTANVLTEALFFFFGHLVLPRVVLNEDKGQG